MQSSEIPQIRLTNQHLIGEKYKTPQEAVSRLGAVQAQDYFAALWSVGQRTENSTETMVEQAFNDSTIIRTHIMRPTWHFVMPEDVMWMQQLTSHRVKSLMKTYNKKLELTDEVFKKSNEQLIKSLQNNNYRTRQEIKILFEGIGIKTDVQRLAHILMHAELEGLICSGPRRGKQFTYSLLNDRITKSKELNHDEALALLTFKYFSSHGPAQLKDFCWWSGLTMKEALLGIELNRSHLAQEIIEDTKYWFSPDASQSSYGTHSANLLSIYDEYTIAYKDRSALGSERYIEKFISMGNLLTGVMIYEGKVFGTWKRKLGNQNVSVFLHPLNNMNKIQLKAFVKVTDEYGRFLNLPVHVEYPNSKTLK